MGPAFIKVGSRVRYKLEALDEFLNTKAQQGEAAQHTEQCV